MKSLSGGPRTASTERQLLQSVVSLARHAYRAAASSVFMISPDNGDLVFAAVSGAGEDKLVGTRFPAGTGIAGWVAASCQPLICDDVGGSVTFARDAAASTGYIPASIMAAPLIAAGECIGVLEVLDRGVRAEAGGDLDDIELLGLIAAQAALSLSLLCRTESGRPRASGIDAVLDRLAEHAKAGPRDPLAVALLGLAADLLERDAPWRHEDRDAL